MAKEKKEEPASNTSLTSNKGIKHAGKIYICKQTRRNEI
jgi:hypothetical protein